jgi:pimeloyl-ACP methyl ester carboxylesterase
MEALCAALSGQYAHVHTLDFPGHGAAPETGFSTQVFTDATLAYMDENGIAEAHFFGYSMGGYVALQLALQAPDRVRAIVTLGTKFDWTPETAARTAATLNLEKWQEKVPDFVQMLRERHPAQSLSTLVENTRRLMRHLGDGAALTEAQLADIVAPALILAGDADTTVSQEESAWAAHHLLAAQCEILPGVKHPFEQVDIDLLTEQMVPFFMENE